MEDCDSEKLQVENVIWNGFNLNQTNTQKKPPKNPKAKQIWTKSWPVLSSEINPDDLIAFLDISVWLADSVSMDNTLWSRAKSSCTSNLPFFWQSTEGRDSCAAIAKANKKPILDETKPCLQRDLSWSDAYLQANCEVINTLEPILPLVPHCSCMLLNDDWIQGCCCPPYAHLCLPISNASWYWGDRSSVTLLSPFCNKAIKTSFKSISLHWVLKVLVSVFEIHP